MVVVAGRPNVGKSALVNRIAGRRVAVVEKEPGVTRDRNAIPAEWTGVRFNIVDTGGWEATGEELAAKVAGQAEAALRGAAVVLFVVDVNVGVTEDDVAVAKLVRRLAVPVLLVVNKVDDSLREPAAWEFASLGLGEPFVVSALHGRGSGDLLDAVVAHLQDRPSDRPPEILRDADVVSEETARNASEVDIRKPPKVPRVAIVGRPNVGKSTLFNRLVGEDRSVVHDVPGTTRDSIDTVIDTEDGQLCFVDTAGMRRPARTDPGTEHYAVLRALSALEKADVALLVIDSTVGVTHQDQRLAERIEMSGCPVVVLLNKWDLVGKEAGEAVLGWLGDRLAFVGTAPVLKTSAHSGRGVHRVLPALQVAIEAYRQRSAQGRSIAPYRSCRPRLRRGELGSATRCRERSSRQPSPCSVPAHCRGTISGMSSAACANGLTWVQRR